MKHRMGSHDLAGRVRVVEVLSSVKRALDLQGDSLFLYKKPADLALARSLELYLELASSSLASSS